MKKIFKPLIFLICFLSVSSAFAQKEKLVRVLSSSGTPITGLTGSNIKFLKSPYSYPGDVIAGLTVTESGSQGNYRIQGFTTFQEVKMFIDGIDQAAWYGIQLSGDPNLTFVDQTSDESIAGTKTFTGTLIVSGPAAVLSYPAISPTSTWYISGTPGADQSLVWKKYVVDNFMPNDASFDSMVVIRTNRLYVDSKLAADLAGKQYNDIGSAITYAQTQTPGASSRWEIYILPNQGGVYQESITLPDFIDLIGVGMVGIRGGFSRSGSVALSSRCENIYFEVYDLSHVVTRVKAYNCIWQTLVDAGSGGQITITSCQLKDCGLFGNYDEAGDDIISAQNNLVINCFGNHPVAWYSNDKVLGYNYNETAGFTFSY